MQNLVARVGLTGCLLGIVSLGQIVSSTVVAQTPTSEELYYTFYGRKIPLTQRQDRVAVQFQATGSTRGTATPLYQQLQQDLVGGSRNARGGSNEPALSVDVKPLGERYALVTLPTEAQSRAAINQRIQHQTYVEEILPVLTHSDPDEQTPSLDIVLPNEIILSFEPELTSSQRQVLLNRYGLEMVRPLQFSRDRYIVRSRADQGIAVLGVANRLNDVAGIQSATPNFIQSLAYRLQEQDAGAATLANIPDAAARLQQILKGLALPEAPFQSDLLPLAWHLDSTPKRGRLLPRTDVQATAAWQHSSGGQGVVVAVIDSLIQWDHPDLADNLYTVSGHPNPFPGEEHGWDFSSDQTTCSEQQPDQCVPGDPDTRISAAELAALRPPFQDTFRLSDGELLEQYHFLVDDLVAAYPHLSSRQLADVARNLIRNAVSSEFHGTWSAGVVAAAPQDGHGALGVAPRAQILPTRVFGLNGETNPASLTEAIGYAADRGADVINLSLGGLLPNQEITDQIFQVLDTHPNLVIVASAGNESLDGVSFPAAIPGVLSVGATTLEGRRTHYSSYGGRLDVVAPGGETALSLGGGILTTGGTWSEGFWQGIAGPAYAWGTALDDRGQYVQVQGTSFAAPIVSGVLALMRGENADLSRDRLIAILKATASYEGLTLSSGDRNRYRLQREVGLTQAEDRLSGIFPLPEPISAETYFFGSGLVNAIAAVREAQR